MYTGKADRNAVYKTHKFFNRECKKGRSLFFLSVISAAAILAGTVLTGCRRADDLVQEQAEPENYALTVFTAQERKEWEPVIKEFEERTGWNVRVETGSAKEMLSQLEKAGCPERAQLPFQKAIIEEKLPYTIGGGIGQSRLCMLLLGSAHIGEVQASVWDNATREACEKAGIPLL